MKLISLLCIPLLSLSLMACGQQSQETEQDQILKNVNAQEFHDLFSEKGGQLIDVRTDGEVDQGYIANATHIDFYLENFDEEVSKLDKEKPVFVYCAAGGRSGKAMNKMKKLGFKEVYHLSGGYSSWVSKGFEVTN